MPTPNGQVQRIFSFDAGYQKSKTTFIIVNSVLYACGSNYNRELGFGYEVKICPSFSQVSNVHGIIKDIISTEYGTFILTDLGLYACGSTSSYSGLGSTLVTSFTRIPNLPNNIFQVISNGSCTFAVTDQGLFACGSEINTGLGSDKMHQGVFAPVPNLTGNIQQIIITSSRKTDMNGSNAFVLTDTGLFVCGDNQSGELGLGHSDKCDKFTQVLNIQGKIHRIIEAKTSGQVSGVYIETDNNLLTSGSRNYSKYLSSYDLHHQCLTFKPVPGISGKIKFISDDGRYFVTSNGLFVEKQISGSRNNYYTNEPVSFSKLKVPNSLVKQVYDELDHQLVKEDPNKINADDLSIKIFKGNLNEVKRIYSKYSNIPDDLKISFIKSYYDFSRGITSVGLIGLKWSIEKSNERINLALSHPFIKSYLGVTSNTLEQGFEKFIILNTIKLEKAPVLSNLVYDILHNATPFELALLTNQIEIAEFLLQKSVKSNLTSNRLYLPLHIAIATKNLPALRLLVQHGADMKATVKIVCTNNDIFQGKFDFYREGVATGRSFTGYKYNNGVNVEIETWVFDASPLALTLLVKNPNDPNDAEKTKQIAEFLCKQGANFNEKINAPRARNPKHFLRLDQLDSYRILPAIRNAIRAEKPKHIAKNDSAFFKQVDKINAPNSESEQIQHMQKQIDNLTNIVLTLQAEVNQLKQKLGGGNNYSQVKFNRK